MPELVLPVIFSQSAAPVSAFHVRSCFLDIFLGERDVGIASSGVQADGVLAVDNQNARELSLKKLILLRTPGSEHRNYYA